MEDLETQHELEPTSKIEYLNYLNERSFFYYYTKPKLFLGILENIELQDYGKENLFNLFLSLNIFCIEEDSYSLKKDHKATSYIENPNLRQEYLEQVYADILYSICDKLEETEERLEVMLSLYSNLDDKISFIQDEINQTQLKLNIFPYPKLFTLYKSSDLRVKMGFKNWLNAIERYFIFPIEDYIEFRSVSKIEDLNSDIIEFLSNESYQPSFGPSRLKEYTDWSILEEIIHTLEFLENVLTNLKDSTYSNSEKKTIEKRNNLEISHTDQQFLLGITQILKDEKYLDIFHEILELDEEKNIPFYTAIFNFFGGQEGLKEKLFIDDKPSNYIKLVNNSYDINMKRLIHETGSRPNRLKMKFSKIYQKYINTNQF